MDASVQAAPPAIGAARRELASLLRLALPIIVAQLAQMGMAVADVVMAARVSAADVAGVALGGNLYWPVMILLSGMLQSVTPSVSQLHGARRIEAVGHVVRQALWLAVIGGVCIFLLLQFSGSLYRTVGVDPRAIPIAVEYLDALLWGLTPVLGYFALRYLCDGMSWTTPGMLIAVSALILKVPLNWLFIYGGLGIEPMGGVGCGWASAIVMWYELIAMLLIVRFSRMRALGVFARFSPPDRCEIVRLVKLGLPIGAARFFEVGVFSGIALLIGRLGVEALAAHQIAGNVNGITFMIPLALGVAATIRVGYNVGAGDLRQARTAGLVAIGASVGFAAVAALILFAFRGPIAGWYSTQPALLGLAAELLVFVAFYQFFDDAQAAAIGALHGYKDTRVPMLVTLVAYWMVALPLGAALGFGWNVAELGVHGFWWGLTVGLALVAIVLCARFQWLSTRPARIAYFSGR